MALLQLRNIELENGDVALFSDVNLSLEPRERVCLVGRNGMGKSTLMKLLVQQVKPDAGELIKTDNLRMTYLPQEVPQTLEGRVFDLVAAGLASHEDDGEEWQSSWKIDTVLSRLSLEGEAVFSTLSGGWKRRVLLAKALVSEPDLLLLDEPTNHLDIPAIEWLESFLQNFKSTLLFVSHDRHFVQKLATRVIELDRGHLSSWPGDFAQYQKNKQLALEAEAREQALFDKRLAAEEAWIRQGIKARRTRNEGRVRRLKAMREAFSERRKQMGKVNAQVGMAEASGKVVIEAHELHYAWDKQTPLVKGFSTTLLRGDKLGVIGANGVGKTTLVRLLLGDIEPQQGKVNLGTRLEVAYFDQHRSQFDEEASLRDNIAPGTDYVEINGQNKHVISYLQDFLFTPQQSRKPVKVLSGGERNRLLLARLFAQPSNLLVLDEPTNDLDADTLELLEEWLVDYTGTLILISHDRSFLNAVVTRTLVFEGEGQWGEYPGGYDDWLAQRPLPDESLKKAKPVDASKSSKPAQASMTKPKKLGYKAQRELEQLPQHIEQLEQQLTDLQNAMSDPAFFKQEARAISAAQQELSVLEERLATAFERWEVLENMS